MNRSIHSTATAMVSDDTSSLRHERSTYSLESDETLVNSYGPYSTTGIVMTSVMMNKAQRKSEVPEQWMRLFLDSTPVEDVEALQSSMSVTGRCLDTLHRILQSMHGYCQIIPDLAMFKEAWNLQCYHGNEADFPLLDVPIKVNSLTTLSNLLVEHRASNYNTPVEQLTTVLQYLNKLLQASRLDSARPAPARPRSDSRSSRRSFGHKKPDARLTFTSPPTAASLPTDSDSASIFSDQSLTSTVQKAKRGLFNRLMPRRKGSTSIRPAPGAAKRSHSRHSSYTPSIFTDDNLPAKNEASFRRQNLEAMAKYQNLVLLLHTELAQLAPSPQTDVLFSFVAKSILPFLISDCRTLVRSCVSTLLLEKL
ncbi:AaceriAGL292Cp [[Ashbya] aceris (nom. inval.)]|nr:AaceriAGL292Cp [[Ashbya] aceris (nom. inval.)]